MKTAPEISEISAQHGHVIAALHEGVSMVRAELGDAFDEISDLELLKLIRLAYGDGQSRTDMAAQIDADHRAIRDALNAGGLLFATRLMACA